MSRTTRGKNKKVRVFLDGDAGLRPATLSQEHGLCPPLGFQPPFLLNMGPKGGAPKGGGPKISRFFFPLPPQFSFFSPSLGGPFVEFWWCLKRRGREMCTFGVLRLSCASPGGPVWWGRRVSHNSQRAQTTFEGPGLQKHHQKSTKGPQERERRMKIAAVVRRRVVRRRVVQGRVSGSGFRVHVFGDKNRNRKKEEKRKRKKKEHNRHHLFDFGQRQFRLWPISTSANFDFGQLSEVELAEVEHPRGSKGWL